MLKEDVWYALSDLFVDNEVDFGYMARQLKGVPIEEVKYRLFYEVCPIYGSIYFTTVPSVWMGYSREPFVANIAAHVAKMQKSNCYNCLTNLKAKFYMNWIKEEWQQLEVRLINTSVNTF